MEYSFTWEWICINLHRLSYDIPFCRPHVMHRFVVCVCVCIFVLFYAMSKCSVLYDLLAASGNMRYWARNISINHSLKLCACSTSLVHSLSLSPYFFLSFSRPHSDWLLLFRKCSSHHLTGGEVAATVATTKSTKFERTNTTEWMKKLLLQHTESYIHCLCAMWWRWINGNMGFSASIIVSCIWIRCTRT